MYHRQLAFFIILLFSFTSLAPSSRSLSHPQREIQSEPLKKNRCQFSLLRIARRSVELALLGTVIVAAPSIAMNVTGQMTGTPHVGLSIYLDMDGVKATLSEEELPFWENPSQDPLKLVKILNAKLSKHYSDASGVLPIMHPRKASSYFGSTPPVEDVCRHKASILAGILKKKGIRAEVRAGTITTDSGEPGDHVWVYLPEYESIADPTIGYLGSKKDWAKDIGLQKESLIQKLFIDIGGAYVN